MSQYFNVSYKLKPPKGLDQINYKTFGRSSLNKKKIENTTLGAWDWNKFWDVAAGVGKGVLSAFGMGGVADAAIGVVDGIIVAAGGTPSQYSAQAAAAQQQTYTNLQVAQQQGVTPSQTVVQNDLIYNVLKQTFTTMGITLSPSQDTQIMDLINMLTGNFPESTTGVTSTTPTTTLPTGITAAVDTSAVLATEKQKIYDENVVIPKATFNLKGLKGVKGIPYGLKKKLRAYQAVIPVNERVIIEGEVKSGINPNTQAVEFMKRLSDTLETGYASLRKEKDLFEAERSQFEAERDYWATHEPEPEIVIDDEPEPPPVIPPPPPIVVPDEPIVTPEPTQPKKLVSLKEKLLEYLEKLKAFCAYQSDRAYSNYIAIPEEDRDEGGADYWLNMQKAGGNLTVLIDRKIAELNNPAVQDQWVWDYWTFQLELRDTWITANKNVIANWQKFYAECVIGRDGDECRKIYKDKIETWGFIVQFLESSIQYITQEQSAGDII